jgi:hypothetical protein
MIHGTSATTTPWIVELPGFVNETVPDGFCDAGAVNSDRGVAVLIVTGTGGGSATTRRTGTERPPVTPSPEIVDVPLYVPAGCCVAVRKTTCEAFGARLKSAGVCVKKLPDFESVIVVCAPPTFVKLVPELVE